MSSLYIHIPFCLQKCDYCDFFSRDSFTPTQLDEYVELLLRDLQLLPQRFPHQPSLETVFFGGGTPSLLSGRQVERLLEQTSQIFGLAEDCEISLEANPGTVSANRLSAYHQAGINRLSLGLQSMNDNFLRLLGRVHSAEQGRAAVAMARKAGFDNLNLDLIFALPGQSFTQLEEDICDLLRLDPEHLAIYGLTFEPGTPLDSRLQNGELNKPDEQIYADHYLLINQRLTAAGFEHYEISNFSRRGYRCQHNQVYWQRETCMAAGCGAHEFDAAGWGERRHIPADLSAYRQKLLANQSPMQFLESFDPDSAMSETCYLALRTSDGLARDTFYRQFDQFPEQAFPSAFRQLRNQLFLDNNRWRFDLQSWLLYDHLISAFL